MHRYPMEMTDLFDQRNYKTYVQEALLAKPNKGRGLRLAMAEAIGCPVSHISQVLNGASHFTMEQAEGVNEFLGHTEDEAQFFLLLLQLARAGTPALRKRLENQIQQIAKRRHFLKERLGVKESINSEDQAKFYSTWLYAAVHVIVSIEKYRTKEAISRHLGISLKRTSEILEFLQSLGLVVKDSGGKFSMGTARVHLGSDSPLISKFHTNWRMKTIQSLESEEFADSLHYSSAVTISEADRDKIKTMLVKTIDEIKKIVKDSKEEGIHCLSLDFFRI